MLLDILESGDQASGIKEMDKAALSGLVIGKILEGNFELTMRETCNKIIHARNVVPIWKWATLGRSRFRYWTGDLSLAGEKSRKKWRLLLHVAPWAQSVQRFIASAEANQLTIYVGQDWY